MVHMTRKTAVAVAQAVLRACRQADDIPRQGQILDALAQGFGERDYNALAARLPRQDSQTAAPDLSGLSDADLLAELDRRGRRWFLNYRIDETAKTHGVPVDAIKALAEDYEAELETSDAMEALDQHRRDFFARALAGYVDSQGNAHDTRLRIDEVLDRLSDLIMAEQAGMAPVVQDHADTVSDFLAMVFEAREVEDLRGQWPLPPRAVEKRAFNPCPGDHPTAYALGRVLTFLEHLFYNRGQAGQPVNRSVFMILSQARDFLELHGASIRDNITDIPLEKVSDEPLPSVAADGSAIQWRDDANLTDGFLRVWEIVRLTGTGDEIHVGFEDDSLFVGVRNNGEIVEHQNWPRYLPDAIKRLFADHPEIAALCRATDALPGGLFVRTPIALMYIPDRDENGVRRTPIIAFRRHNALEPVSAVLETLNQVIQR